MPQALSTALLEKIGEQVDRAIHLAEMVPEDKLGWAPPFENAWPAGVVLGHLLECMAGFCAVLAAAEPQKLAHFQQLRAARVNHCCDAAEARERLAVYRTRIEEGFALLADADLARRIRTVFVPGGETVATLLLGNLEHLINHKYQLFLYLRLMGVPAGSADLYRFR